jgi:putative ABC transport system permease protein
MSYDASYSALDMYDVRVALATGSYLQESELASAVEQIAHSEWIGAVEERLIVPTQVDVSTPTESILVRGEITGADFSDGGPSVNGYHAFTGRLLTDGDAGHPIVMLDRNFARFYALPDSGTIEISGGRPLGYVGQATTPEYFTVSPEGEIFLSEANFAGVFTTIETAQQLAGLEGAITDAVITLVPGADRDLVIAELEATLGSLGVGTEVQTRDDNRSYKALTKDVDNDQRIFNMLAFLLFSGAVVAAYIMLHRLAQQQRREIGVAMALGVPPRRIAVRPLLVSAQIALLGVLFGVGIGMLVGNAMQGIMEQFVPLPIWQTPFQTRLFAGVAVAGFLIPFLATAIPVVNAVRVKPVDAIRPLYHKAVPIGRRGRKVHTRGSTFSRMPVHNLRRSPWRSGFTTLAVGLVVMVLIAFLGLMDSIFGAIDDAEVEATGTLPDRAVVSLDGFYSADAPQIAAIGDAAAVAKAEPTLRIGGRISTPAEEIDVLVELLNLRTAMWRPTLTEGAPDNEPGVILTEKAAADLGVEVGDTVTLRHPQRTGPLSFTFSDSQLPVLGLHPYPVRNFVYMDAADASLMGLSGVVNTVQVDPVDTVAEGDLQRELFSLPGVASVLPVLSVTQALEEQMGILTSFIQLITVLVLVLAVLIAFLTSSISLDARVREHATMFAYGVRIRTALRMAVTESAIIGVVATVIGIAGGLAMLSWMTSSLLASTLPDIGLNVVLDPATIVTVVVLGVVAVAVAPLFNVRRMRRLDLPGTLRLME